MSLHGIKNVKAMRVKIDGTNYRAAAGTSDLTSEAVDTQGAESVECFLLVGTLSAGAVTSLNASQCDTSGGSYADLLGSKVSFTQSTDSDKVARLEIVQPRERFLKFVTLRETGNAVIDGMIVLLHGAKERPVADDATIIGSELHVSPAEGTA